jgi:hypothetical protein
MSDSVGLSNLRQQGLAHLLIGLMAISILAPMASAAGMTSCDKDPGAGVDGICDTYSDSDDGTPNLQDWVEGTYEFTMLGTEQIQLDLTWAIREFDREALGFTDPFISSALANDGLDEDDGAPADLIRNYFDQESAGSGSPTVGEKLKIELSNAIEDSLESSFGEVAVTTDYTNQYVDGATTTACSVNPSTDSAEEGASANDVFNPPICISTSALIQLDQSTFNLLPNPDLDLERAYQGLMVMGSEITSTFNFVARPGHIATYTVHPPSYATIDSVDASGTLIEHGGTSPYNSSSWVLDHRLAQSTDGDLTEGVELTLKHRNRTGTSTVEVPSGEKALDLHITLNLEDESAATLDFVAGMHYLDEATLDDWGVSLMSVAERAKVPVVTADGIRLAYHNGLVDLENFTSQFPVDLIAEGVSSTVAGIETIEMGEMTWISSQPATASLPAGGLNYSHSTGCSEVAPAGVELRFCVEGEEAMGFNHPVYLTTTSQPFSMRLLDIISENNNNEDVAELIDVLTEDDFERVLNGGLTIQTSLDSDYLSAIVPANLPPSEVTLEIILPSWVRTADGSDRLILRDTIEGNQDNSISFAGTNPYDWRNVVRDDYQNVKCESTERTCVTSEVEMDAMSINLNEFTRTAALEFALDADVSVHRINIPQEYIPETGEHSVNMEVLPSDLVRLALDIASRVDEPINRTYNLNETLGKICDDYNYSICEESVEFLLTSEGLMALVKQVGELFTQFIHEAAERLTDIEDSPFTAVDISEFEFKTRLKGVGAPDLIVSDEDPLSLTLNIPKVTFKLQLDGDIGKILSGDLEGLEVSLLTSTIRSTFVYPMAMMMQSLTGMLTNGIVAWDGVTLPNGGDSSDVMTIPFQFDSTLNEEFQVAMNGPFTLLMPSGITLENLESSQGNIDVRTVDGRQEITYTIPAGDVDDTVTFQLHFSWLYFFVQFWKYPAILVILLLLYVRRRRRKRKKKRARRAANVAAKPQLSNDEFADLSGFSSKAFHGDLDELRDFNNDAPPPIPPMPPMDIPMEASVPSFDETLLHDLGDERFD